VGLGLLAAACSPLEATRGEARGRGPRAARSSEERAAAVFAAAERRARARLRGAPIGPPPDVPDVLRGIAYERYREIRYRPERSVFRGEGRQFELQLFHRGFYYGRPVDVVLHGESGSARLAFDASRFTYPSDIDPSRFGDLGYAGLRVHAPLHRQDYFDEFLVFLGASYFRAVGRGCAYGLSGRCLSIDTGLGVPEEFPDIVALHLMTPAPGETVMHVVAELRGPRVEGAFHFRVAPGDDAVLDVDAVVLLREEVSALGLAPLTSMYLFGESSTARFGDFRPEVHDSDGLLLVAQSGERIFRPLRNPKRSTLSSFRLDSPRGFGLVQRDRSFASYQDLESRYEARPSAWVEPRGDFGAGAVRLLENATELETDDNIGAFFVPDRPGRELRYGYRLRFGAEAGPGNAGARVVGLRSGVPGAGNSPERDGSRIFVVDFAGPSLEGIAEVTAMVDATGGRASGVRTQKNPNDGSVRLFFRVAPAQADVELRAFLRAGDDVLGETLSYLWQPTEAAG
jgi:glucans biosynthesis protein